MLETLVIATYVNETLGQASIETGSVTPKIRMPLGSIILDTRGATIVSRSIPGHP
jgi:hypothetical protein